MSLTFSSLALFCQKADKELHGDFNIDNNYAKKMLPNVVKEVKNKQSQTTG